jgi:tRNA 5-methylaminomethyl-2-thiouridine biosynthesis bifunctional protein
MLIPAQPRFRDGVPYSEAFGDLYHSAAGGPAQSRFVFLEGNQLPGRWAGRERFVILETGFGLGLNFLVTLQAWRRDPRRCRRLHYVAIEKHPFSLNDLRALHERYPELGEEAADLHAVYPLLVPGGHRAELGGVVLTLFLTDVKIVRDLRLAADALYLDGFAPDRNPEMWSPQLMRALSRLCARDATAATWSVAAPVRHALEQTGFAVEKRPGFGHKREMLTARSLRGRDADVSRNKTAVVVGAGLAGAAVCERLCARGWEVTLHERNTAAAPEASARLAGVFHPIVTPDDSHFARLTRAGFLASLSNWRKLPEIRWDPCGVLQLARHDKEDDAQRRATAGLPAEYAQYVTREEASAHAGVPVSAGGVWFPGSGWIQPRSLVAAQLDACGKHLRRKYSDEVKTLPDAGVVILANSLDAPKLHAVPHLRLRRVRGQVTYVPAERFDPPRVVVLRGGMVLPPVEGLCTVGATFDIDDDDPAPRADSEAGNLERLAKILGVVLEGSFENRVGFRAVTPDRLPVVGKIADDVYGAFAYGSRGLVWAALAAEIIASELEGEPLPIEGTLADAIAPGRFRKRAESRRRPS